MEFYERNTTVYSVLDRLTHYTSNDCVQSVANAKKMRAKIIVSAVQSTTSVSPEPPLDWLLSE